MVPVVAIVDIRSSDKNSGSSDCGSSSGCCCGDVDVVEAGVGDEADDSTRSPVYM